MAPLDWLMHATVKFPSLRSLERLLPRNYFARGVSILVSGTAAAQALTVLAAPLLTRLYSPDDFGLLAVYASLLSLIMVVSSLRYKLAIRLPEDDGEAANVAAIYYPQPKHQRTAYANTAWYCTLPEAERSSRCRAGCHRPVPVNRSFQCVAGASRPNKFTPNSHARIQEYRSRWW